MSRRTVRYRPEPFTLADPREECTCDHCARPLVVGDRAHYAELVDAADPQVCYADGIYCSPACATLGLHRAALRAELTYATAHA